MSVEQVAHLISRQKSTAESITETYSKLMSVGVEKVSVDRIEIRLSALRDQWSSFSLTDEHLNLELLKLHADDQPALKADPYFTNFVYKVTYEAYLDALEQLTILHRNLKEPATLSSSSVSDVSNIVAWSQVSRIPAINVPPFDGTPSKWLSFKGLFTSVYLSNKHLTPVEKLQHLKLKLVGSAEHLLRDTELLDANLDKAWNAVVDYYENSRVLLNSLFDNLFKAEPMSKESSQELERLYTIVSQVRRNLETMERTRHDDLLVYIIVQMFDSHTRRMWGNALGSQKLPASWEQFEGFLKSRINSIQDVESKPVVLNRADKPTHHRQHVARSHHVNSFSNDKNNGFTCSLCSAHHYLAHCPTFQQKSSKQKWEFIKSKRLCFNCLSTKHQSGKCPSSRRCLKCAKKHHTSLHQITTTLNSSNKTDPSTQSLPSTSNSAQVNHAYHSPSSASTILLATAKVFITTAQGKTLAARALLDQGSEVSFITENLVHHLQSPRQPSSLYLLGVGGHKTNKTKEYKQLQHMVQVPDQELNLVPSFYLPHHGVLRESSLTTKLRVVFNGSCRVNGGVPLNELLHTGAKHQIDLFDVLVWLRQHRYIFASDIEKMYRQIQIHPEDWRFQRILWKEHDQLVTYQLTTVTYGLACAPFLALRATQQLIQDEGVRFPLAVDILNKGRYVDDIFGGANSIEEAQLKADQVYQLCIAGGLPLRKWISNHPDILKLIPSKYHAESLKVDIKDHTVKALGLSWSPQADYFFFNLTVSTSTIITKRSVLSQTAQFFDPLGLLSPLFINFKVFMQELWAIRVNWDDHLPINQIQTWHSLLSTLSGLESIQIPRWIGSCSNEHVELHGFGDASQKAMAAVVFIKTVVGDVVNISLICSKTKVAPLKRMTIPRLELSASVMLVKLVTHCQAVLNMEKFPCYLWTDSSIVYTWVNNHPSKWKEFVHNRVCFIQETLPTAQWKHISGKINPADCATRGLTSTELKEHSIWWKGPSWLAQDPSFWPSSLPAQVNDEQDLELKQSAHVVSCHAVSDQFIQFFSRYSSLAKLIRVIARIQRIINLFGKRSQIPVDSRLTTSDLDIAHKTLIKTIQNKYFSKEIKIIRDKKELPNSNALLRLTPFCDADGLLRVGGRLMNAAIPLSAKQPYIVPKDAPLTSLIIKYAHLQTLHGSVQNTLAYIRNTYWIIGGRVPVKSFILKCITCFRQRHSSAQQLMGQLPATRVNPSRPFAHSGVDYAGPFNVKTWKAKSVTHYKSWIAVFVCHATSAVHLEIVTDYSTDAFLAAYRRFTSRRGICQTLNSDCGTNFQGADRELKRFFSITSTQLNEFATLIANHGTQWSFNPPAAPHFGGKFEAAVKLMKYHLKRVIGDTLLTYEELSTVLAQVEATLNSRPLCALTDDPDDLNALTPGHFLIGQPLNLVPEPNLELINITRLDRWQRLSQMLQSYWKMWSKAYLQRFQTIYKWNRELPNMKKGTLVLVIDERYPPAKWPLGRIIETHPGSNGLVRVVTIKTSTTTIKRPITKVSPLPISS